MNTTLQATQPRDLKVFLLIPFTMGVVRFTDEILGTWSQEGGTRLPESRPSLDSLWPKGLELFVTFPFLTGRRGFHARFPAEVPFGECFPLPLAEPWSGFVGGL